MSDRPRHERGEEPAGPNARVARNLFIAQFVLTVVIVGGLATLTWHLGIRSVGERPGAVAPGLAGLGGTEGVDVKVLLSSTPDLLNHGKSLFAINCASCHGPEGKGDGPAAVALNPKPRNLSEGYWRYGGGVARVVQTITVGSPGTSMAGFTGLALQDRFALAHFVRSLAPKPQEDTPEDLAWLGPAGGAAAADTGASFGALAQKGPTIPIEQAMAALTVPEKAPGFSILVDVGGEGARLWTERCASCHGAAGEGGVRVRMLGSSPYAYVLTRSLGQPSSTRAESPAAFETLVIYGLPGYLMPGNGDLTRAEVQELYLYTQLLRARQTAAGTQS